MPVGSRNFFLSLPLTRKEDQTMDHRTSWLIAGLSVLVFGAAGLFWHWRASHDSQTSRIPIVSAPGADQRSVRLAPLTIPESLPSAWSQLQQTNHRLMASQWQTIRRQFPSLATASLGRITPSLVGFASSHTVPVLQTPGFHTTVARWQQAVRHVPDSVAPSNIPLTVWRTAWSTAVQDAAQAVGPDPLAIVEDIGPHEGPAFQRFLVRRYTLWHQWQTQHAWMTAEFVSVGTFTLPHHHPTHLAVIRPPTPLSTSRLHLVTLTRVPFVVTVALKTPQNRTIEWAQAGVIDLGLFHVGQTWHWALESLALNAPTALPPEPASATASP